MERNEEVYEGDQMIPADSFLTTSAYGEYVKFSKFRFPFASRTGLQPDSIVKWNPNSYHAYMLGGDQAFEAKDFEKAKGLYEEGLKKEIATTQEREHMQRNLEACKENLP